MRRPLPPPPPGESSREPRPLPLIPPPLEAKITQNPSTYSTITIVPSTIAMPPSSPESNGGGGVSVRKRTEAPNPNGGRKYRSIEEIMRMTKPVDDVTENYYSDVRCQQCRCGDRDGELLLCDRCDLGFHMSCLRPIVVRVPSGPWLCPSCDEEKPKKRFPLMQKKILDFFRIQKCSGEISEMAEGKWGSSSQDGKKRRRRSMPLAMYKRRRRILPYIPTTDPHRRLEQMGTLATALTALNMEFSNDLTYMPGMAPKFANRANLEKGGMQVLAREDKETLDLCRIMCKRGECPPLMVVFDSLEGYTVQADGHIKDMTFITEYTGDVDYLRKREHDDCDSMMTLLLTENSSNNLLICPDKRGNIARFINGINNHSPEGRKKQNLKCVRYNVDGECRVLLVTCRDISPGERLYYDYNGYEQEYPTEHFV